MFERKKFEKEETFTDMPSHGQERNSISLMRDGKF